MCAALQLSRWSPPRPVFRERCSSVPLERGRAARVAVIVDERTRHIVSVSREQLTDCHRSSTPLRVYAVTAFASCVFCGANRSAASMLISAPPGSILLLLFTTGVSWRAQHRRGEVGGRATPLRFVQAACHQTNTLKLDVFPRYNYVSVSQSRAVIG